MSPDIEWHVGEDAEQETIAHTSSTPQSRRGRWAVLIAIGLGVGLGLLYRSIPEPPSKPIDPVPAPAVFKSPLPPRPLSPLPTPEALDAAIERDAVRLSSSIDEADHRITFAGTANTRIRLLVPALQNAYGGWGPPSYLTLYTVFETGTLPGGMTWVKSVNFAAAIFIATPASIAWRMIAGCGAYPIDLSGAVQPPRSRRARQGTIGPITIQHPIEDTPVIGAVFDRFTRTYQNLCESLKCPPQAILRALDAGLTLSVTISPWRCSPWCKSVAARC